MTPEEFLANTDAIRGVIDAMAPMYDLLANVRDGFVGSGFSTETAEELTVRWAEVILYPMLRKEP